jgi:hypothetical protein
MRACQLQNALFSIGFDVGSRHHILPKHLLLRNEGCKFRRRSPPNDRIFTGKSFGDGWTLKGARTLFLNFFHHIGWCAGRRQDTVPLH